MADIRDLMPWRRRTPAEDAGREENPFHALQQHMNEVFDDFAGRFGMPSPWRGGLNGFAPRVNMTEKDGTIYVEAELPGMEEKDIDVQLADDMLTIRGERKEEKKDEQEQFYRREFSYGAFRRAIPLHARVQEDKVNATFKNGVLRIELPVSEEERRNARRINVKAS